MNWSLFPLLHSQLAEQMSGRHKEANVALLRRAGASAMAAVIAGAEAQLCSPLTMEWLSLSPHEALRSLSGALAGAANGGSRDGDGAGRVGQLVQAALRTGQTVLSEQYQLAVQRLTRHHNEPQSAALRC